MYNPSSSALSYSTALEEQPGENSQLYLPGPSLSTTHEKPAYSHDDREIEMEDNAQASQEGDKLKTDRLRKIANQIEFYFSDANLQWDIPLRERLDKSSGFVELEFLNSLSRLTRLKTDEHELETAIAECCISKLELSADRKRVRRIIPFLARNSEEVTERTVYVEHLRPPYTTPHAIARLFKKRTGLHVTFVRVPEVPGLKFSGFCFVEFENESDIERAISEFRPKSQDGDGGDSDEDNSKELRKEENLALRIIPKAKWLELKDEYLKYLGERQRMQHKVQRQIELRREACTQASLQSAPSEEMSDDYPKGIILLAQHVNADTKKDILKKLFGKYGDIEYVDYTRKNDFCYLRMKSSEESEKLAKHFRDRRLMQKYFDDISLTEADNSNRAPITVRILSGQEEAQYWHHIEAMRSSKRAKDKRPNPSTLPPAQPTPIIPTLSSSLSKDENESIPRKRPASAVTSPSASSAAKHIRFDEDSE
ncbi:uncharacterized protein VTP21DRAFT_11714 [Calcarisporiella thermophila]|uniref:uncharacterized protein n=1 Tax=Calcarisporiella thermophila TaxID=911321 RepID=UPI0037443EC9